VRVTLTALLGSSRQPIQIDVGFGDAITNGPVELSFPTLLASDPGTTSTVLAYWYRGSNGTKTRVFNLHRTI
jgi:hypothetical protein